MVTAERLKCATKASPIRSRFAGPKLNAGIAGPWNFKTIDSFHTYGTPQADVSPGPKRDGEARIILSDV